MTQGSEIRRLVAESATTAEERQELAQVVEILENLEGRVPYRPEFRAQLRERLKQEARRTRPWYRRPQVWTAGGAVAAAVGAFAVLSFWQNSADPRGQGVLDSAPPGVGIQTAANPGVEQPAAQPINPTAVVRPTLQLVGSIKIPRAERPDVWEGGLQKAGTYASRVTVRTAEGLTAPPVSEVQKIYLVAELPPQPESLIKRAQRMGFKAEVADSSGGSLRVVESGRSLELHADGRLIYQGDAEGIAMPAPDEAGAEWAARIWLEEAGIVAPAGDRSVALENDLWRVSFTPVMQGGARAITETISVWVAQSGHIVKAETTTGSLEERGEAPSISLEQALQQLRVRTLEGVEGEVVLIVNAAELVYARPVSLRTGEPLYLQPYWRLSASVGAATVHRYVPAVQADYLQ